MTATPERFAPLVRLLDGVTATSLSLAWLEEQCTDLGLDLYLEDHLFIWLMDELHHRGITLSDAGAAAEDVQSEEGLEVQAIAEDIEDIVSLQENTEDRLLSREETTQLLRAVQEGMEAQAWLEANPDAPDKTAKELLVAKKSEAESTLLTRNRGLVLRVCQQYRSSLNSMTLSDLEQEGNLGFLKAIAKFDLNRTTVLSTYAVYWIRQAVQQAIANQDRTIRLPVHKRAEIRHFRIAAEELQNQLGREPTVGEVALRLLAAESGMEDVVARLRGDGEQASATDREHLRRVEENVKELQTYGRQAPSSLDTFVDDEERDQHELLSDDRTESPESEALKQEVIGNIDEQVDKLPEPDRTVMRLLYGLEGEEPRKTSEIAAMFNRDPNMLALLPSRQFTGSYVEAIRKDAASLKASGDSSAPEQPTELATQIMSLLEGTEGLAPRAPSEVADMLNRDPAFRHPRSPTSYNTTRIRAIADRAISSLKNVKSVETLSLDT